VRRHASRLTPNTGPGVIKIAFIRLYNGDDGHAHFEDLNLEFAPRDPDELQSSVGRLNRVNRRSPVHVIPENIQGGFFETQWENVPEYGNTRQRHYVIFLSGVCDVWTKTGETRRIYPGDVLLNEDMAGTGHVGRIVEKPWVWFAIMLAKDNDPSSPNLD